MSSDSGSRRLGYAARMTRAQALFLRLAAVAAVAVLSAGVLLFRSLLDNPPVRTAMAGAPDGAVYLATGIGQRVQVLSPDGRVELRGRLPGNYPLALAADGNRLLLGMEHQLLRSDDGGWHWVDTRVPGRHFISVSLNGASAAAADFDGGIWFSHDSGMRWSKSDLDPRLLPLSAVLAAAAGPWFAVTQVALLRSDDEGLGWLQVKGPPDHLSALSLQNGTLRVASFRGTIVEAPGPAFSSFQVAERLPGGVWAIDGAAAATSNGLLIKSSPVGGALGQREVVALASSGRFLYAAEAGGRAIWVAQTGAWRRISSA